MEVEFFPITDEAFNYLTNVRKLSSASIDDYNLKSDKRGEILIPFYDDEDNLQFVKRRHPSGQLLTRKRKDDESSEWSEYKVKTDAVKGGTPILLGTNVVNDTKDFSILYICYGDYDALSLYTCGQAATSLPNGDRGTNWIERQWVWLQKFQKIVFCPDYDENPKTQAILMTKLEDMVKRLGKHKCWMVTEESMLGLKDINELLVTSGQQAVIDALNKVIPVPEPGLEKLADYAEPEFVEGTPIGFEDLDKATGGHAGGGLTLIGGDNNAGKTTLILNLMAEFMAQQEKCFYWSGEQRAENIRWWVEQIIAGEKYIKSRTSEKSGREYFFADPIHLRTIRDWYREMLFVYNKRGIAAEQFFEVAELAVRRFDVKKIFIDNLMAFTGGEEDKYGAQGDFTQSCKNFSEDWNCHVFLVVHNKKNDHDIPDKDDILGSKDITNWADIIYQVLRINDSNRKEAWGDASGIISLCKNRDTESLIDVRTKFEPKSKRIVQLSQPDKISRRLGWEPEEKSEEFKLEF